MATYPDARSVVEALAPDEPVILNRPHAAARAARFFADGFRGRSLYAVKANPSPDLIRILWDNGITHYDVASIAEVRLVRSILPDAELCFMHPVKPKSAIAEAYHQHGCRTFSLDSEEELAKIVRVIRKKDPDAPHNTLLVLDATVGQNGLAQARAFLEQGAGHDRHQHRA